MTTPQLLRFVVRRITFTLTDSGFIVTCYTNNPCHLFFRYTTTRPQKHVLPRMVRGAQVGTYIDQCFVVFKDNEQEEAGDTFTHTFIKEPWPFCETRWFYFWGMVDGNVSPSASAIFQKHQDAVTLPEMVLIILEPWTEILPEFALILLEPWTVSALPPDFEPIIIEPWTCATLPEMPEFEPVIIEPWTGAIMVLVLLEPWTVKALPPDMVLVLLEPWTVKALPPDFKPAIIEPWTTA